MTRFTPVDVDRVVEQTFVARAEHHDRLDSTNDRAIRLASEPGELPLLIVADRQTAGRGRGTNRWWAGPGSLTASLLLEPEMVAAGRTATPMSALATAVGVVDTVAPLLEQHDVGIHWPNDVIAAGRKLAGILVEVLPSRRHVVGIGLNTNNSLADAPDDLRQTATTLHELTGRPHDQTAILVSLLKNLEAGFAQLGPAPEEIAARANALCLQHGHTLTIQRGHKSTTGRCRGIAPDGALLLEASQAEERFYSGVLKKGAGLGCSAPRIR